MLAKLVDFANEHLKINAIRRMFTMVSVRRSEIIGLIRLTAIFTIFEGVGLSMLPPILQYAESSESAITNGSGIIWSSVAAF